MSFGSLLWFLPGFISLWVFQTCSPKTRNKQGWEYVFPIAILATVDATIAKIITVTTQALCPSGFSMFQYIAEYFGRTQNGEALLVAFLISLPIGWLAPKTFALLTKLLPYSAKSDPYYEVLSELCTGALAVISLKNGRVYFGLLLSFTKDPNESSRTIHFAPS